MPRLPKQPKPVNPGRLRAACDAELARAKQLRELGDRQGAWRHLERAHVLSQPLAGRHVRVHGAMLNFAIRGRDRRELAGQVVRLTVAGPGSLLRRYPLGNTGGADVSAVAPMPIPDDLQAILDSR